MSGDKEKPAEKPRLDFSLTPSRYTYIFASAGILAAIMHNGLLKKFLWQGIYRHIGLALGGAYVGTKYGQWGEYQHAKRDFIIYDYISRHPEDFKKPPVKLVGDQLKEFVPIR